MQEFSTAVCVSNEPKTGELETYRNKSPATNDSSKQLSTADIDIFRPEGHKIVCGANGVGRDIDTESDNDQADGAKSGCGAATMGPACHPQIDNVNGIPENCTFCALGLLAYLEKSAMLRPRVA
jgi:hypothetical protein